MIYFGKYSSENVIWYEKIFVVCVCYFLGVVIIVFISVFIFVFFFVVIKFVIWYIILINVVINVIFKKLIIVFW